MSNETKLRCLCCRWCFTDSVDTSNCTCPSSDITIIDIEDEMMMLDITKCHQYTPLNDDENYTIKDDDTESMFED